MTLILDKLHIGYKNKRLIENIQADIKPGSCVAVIGPNGVGKSTLMKSLASLIKHQGSAKLSINNAAPKELSSLATHERMKHIGYLPQTLPQATNLMAYELVFAAAKAISSASNTEINQRIDSVFEQLGITHIAMKQMREMSGGQRQMVGLAQVLVRKPDLLLLDEPTSALDLHWQLNVLQAIHRQTTQHNAIALIASHDLNLALRYCDQLLILSRQGVLAMGTPEEVLSVDHLRTAYGIEGRIEACSKGFPIVLADNAVSSNY